MGLIWTDWAVMLPSELALPVIVTVSPTNRSSNVPWAVFETDVLLENKYYLRTAALKTDGYALIILGDYLASGKTAGLSQSPSCVPAPAPAPPA